MPTDPETLLTEPDIDFGGDDMAAEHQGASPLLSPLLTEGRETSPDGSRLESPGEGSVSSLSIASVAAGVDFEDLGVVVLKDVLRAVETEIGGLVRLELDGAMWVSCPPCGCHLAQSSVHLVVGVDCPCAVGLLRH